MPGSVRPDLHQRLGFQAGPVRGLVALADVCALVPWPGRSTPVPFGHNGLVGLVPWQTKVVPVCDLPGVLGVAGQAVTPARLLLIVAGPGGLKTAWTVTALCGLRSVAGLPRVEHTPHPCVAQVWRDGPDQLWYEIAVPSLLELSFCCPAERLRGVR